MIVVPAMAVAPSDVAPAAAPSMPLVEDQLLRSSNAGAGDRFGTSVAVDGSIAVVGAPEEDGGDAFRSDAGAAYVYERTVAGTWTEVAVLRASNAGAGDLFGTSVGVSGTRIVVGAVAEDGVGDEVGASGAAYVFERQPGGSWGQVALLRAAAPEAGDNFGAGVAASGDRIVVGAPFDDGASDQDFGTGAVYVFERSPRGWPATETVLLRASNAEAFDGFGTSVAISGDRLVVGAPFEDGPVNETPGSGAAYVFERSSGGAWPERALLRASNREFPDLAGNDAFGTSVALSGDRLVAGAPAEDGPNNTMTGAGAAYVFDRTAQGWPATETDLLRASDAEVNAFFGTSVSLDAARIAVGARFQDGGNQALRGAGRAYAFEKPPAAGWGEVATLSASNAGSDDGLGVGVAIGGVWALAGAPVEDGPNNTAPTSGAVYAFNLQDVVIPVELASFSASRTPNGVALAWQTTTETHNAGFHIERSTTDAGAFQTVGFEPGHGTTVQPKAYGFLDRTAPPAARLTYRLRQVDTDGTPDLSPEVHVATAVRSTRLVAVAPQPAREAAWIRFEVAAAGRVALHLYDVLGRRIRTLDRGARPRGVHRLRVDLTGCAPGTYFVRMTGAAHTDTVPLRVVR